MKIGMQCSKTILTLQKNTFVKLHEDNKDAAVALLELL